jgi:hypothetical protein
VVTADAFAVNSALAAPAGTVTDAGTATALSLLVRPTAKPPGPAVAFSVNVQSSDSVPRIDAFKQVSPVSTGTPVPLRATDSEDAFEALLATVSWPLAEPDAVGLNERLNCTLALAATVIGRLPPPLIVKDCPLKLTWEI